MNKLFKRKQKPLTWDEEWKRTTKTHNIAVFLYLVVLIAWLVLMVVWIIAP